MRKRGARNTHFPAVTRSREAGFTLIELLTVVAILGILSAILIPVTAQVRATARQSHCGSNLRQIGVAVRLFADDNHGFLPGTAHKKREMSWIYSLHAYLDNVDEIRICPADPRADEKRLTEGATSYVMNDLLLAPAEDEFERIVGADYRRIDQLQTPSATMLAFIGADHKGMSARDDHTHASNWSNNWSALLNDIAPDRHRSGTRTSDRSTGSANYLFADGHVETIAATEIRRRIEAGENIAVPPEAR